MASTDDLLARRSQLSPERQALLDRLLRGKANGAATGIPRRTGQRPASLSPGQERLWFLDLMAPGMATYTMPFGLRLTGRLDLRALWRSLEGIIRRHETLRTTFPVVGGRPTQRVAETAALDFPLEDLTSLPLPERESAAARIASEEARRPFDLANGPLMRARLLRLADEDHVLLLTMHHIIS